MFVLDVSVLNCMCMCLYWMCLFVLNCMCMCLFVLDVSVLNCMCMCLFVRIDDVESSDDDDNNPYVPKTLTSSGKYILPADDYEIEKKFEMVSVHVT